MIAWERWDNTVRLDEITGQDPTLTRMINKLGKDAIDDLAAGRTEKDSDKRMMAKLGIDILTTIKNFCIDRVGPNRRQQDKKDAYPYLLKMYANQVNPDIEPDEPWPADVEEMTAGNHIGVWMARSLLNITVDDLVEFEMELDPFPPITEFFMVWMDGPDEFERVYELPWKEYVKDVINLREGADPEVIAWKARFDRLGRI